MSWQLALVLGCTAVNIVSFAGAIAAFKIKRRNVELMNEIANLHMQNIKAALGNQCPHCLRYYNMQRRTHFPTTPPPFPYMQATP